MEENVFTCHPCSVVVSKGQSAYKTEHDYIFELRCRWFQCTFVNLRSAAPGLSTHINCCAPLRRLHREGLLFSEAAQLAQAKGLCETDPRHDFSGADFRRRMTLVCRAAGSMMEVWALLHGGGCLCLSTWCFICVDMVAFVCGWR